MRIAFITMGNDIGGAAQDVITLSQGLLKLGHKVFVISSPGVMDEELYGTGVIFINAPLYTRNPLGLWKASRRIHKIVKCNNIEILNPQGMFTALSAWLASFGFDKCRFKVVTTIHMISSLKLYKYTWALNIFSKRIITESYCERSRLTSSGVKRDKVSVISNSVDMERFSKAKSKPVLRSEYKIEDSCCCFGIIARLSKEKRHLDFINAAKIAHTKNLNTIFFIVGDGPEKERIMESIKGSEDFIIVTGMRRDIPDILNSLDCFVLSSEIESLPLSIREAMSMGLPVISTDVGGVREAVIEGITGLVVPPHNPQLMAAAMIKIANNKELRISLGTRGLELCQTNFELSKWSQKTEELFARVLNN
jgi:glycosyltransferase involved in cell wall biosynthesis